MNIFNIHIEFDSKVFCRTIEDYISKKKKAYVCVVDSNVITMAQNDLKYREIVNGADINTCDGSSISMMANSIYGTHYSAFNGPELFEYYIEKKIGMYLWATLRRRLSKLKRR